MNSRHRCRDLTQIATTINVATVASKSKIQLNGLIGRTPDTEPTQAQSDLRLIKAADFNRISRRLVLKAGASVLSFLAAPMVWAQAPYPSRPVRLVVPLPAGTSPDIIARLWANRFTQSTGQAVVVENRPGAGTIIAAQVVASAPADGYTLLWTVNNTFSINPYLYRTLPYKAEDFVPITRVLSVPFVLMVSAQSKIQTLKDLMGHAKERPGALSYGSVGIGTAPHVIMARLMNMAGVDMTHVPYKESFIPDLIAQRIDLAFDASTTAIANLQGGKLRALGISSVSRVNALKDVPTIGDSYPGFSGESWHGIFAPKGTPPSVVSIVAEQSQTIVQDPSFRDSLRGFGLVPAGGSSEEFRKFLAEDAKTWAGVIKSNNITAD